MAEDFYQVDAFTDKPFYGNPAAVVILDKAADEAWMRKVAEEMNLSETAFLHKVGTDEFILRWFTPLEEVDLCGHATLASAHILWEKAVVNGLADIKFNTGSGQLVCRKSSNGLIKMDFPREEAEKSEVPEAIYIGLGVKLLFTGKNRMDYLVEVESEEILRNLNPDFTALRKLDSRGVIVTARSENKDFDFVSRFFAPAVGIYEDPVTGSAHCCLAPYWAKKLGKTSFKALQVSKRRGILEIELVDDRVNIKGRAITVFKGTILF